MKNQIVESLELVNYNGQLLDAERLEKVVADDKINGEFRNLVSWISNEIAGLGNLDERISKDDDLNTFLLELSGFLKEIQCPYNIFMAGPVSSRLNTCETRYLLLEFLLSELMAQKMSNVNRTKDTKKDLAITLHETPTAAALKEIAITLNLGKPPENITPKLIFDKINGKFDEIISRTNGMKRLGKPLFCPKTRVSDENWTKLTTLQKELDDEYDLRRKMLLTRLDCTVQSFQWSEKVKGKGETDITERFAAKRQKLETLITGGQRTDIPALLAAREQLAIIEKTSSANVRRNTRSKIQRHIMGSVPDRGGRAYEHQPPPPEMPSWQKNRAGGPQGGGNRGGGNFNRGNHHNNQGYQQQQQHHQQQQSYGNNYQNNQGGGYNRGNYHNQGGYQDRGGHQNYQQRQDSYNNDNNRQQGQYHQQNRGGGSRVQGGWSQKGNMDGGYQQQEGGGRRDNYHQRGHSNYNRGGRR